MKDQDQDWGRRAFSLAAMVPELAPPFARTAPVRIPELRNVALTRRVLRVIDHPDFQRLRRVLQLGPTHLVYPGAVHTRFEHSIGVYENVRHYLQSLLVDPVFASAATEEDILTALAAGLLHDLGHYPFAHSLEALHHKGLEAPHHESLANEILFGLLSSSPLAGQLEKEWRIDPHRVMRLVTHPPGKLESPMDRALSSILHCPIDADKMDYLERDSIHMGVPYGRNYDRDRLLSTLRINPANNRLAVTDKGKISAEIFIFCRYTMFSEAYWHHTVRAASAMVERGLEDFRQHTDLSGPDLARFLLRLSDEALLGEIRQSAGSPAREILTGMAERNLYKRVLSLSLAHRDEAFRQAYELVFRLDRAGVHRLEDAVRERISRLLGQALQPWEVIIDTPPPGKDRIEDVDVLFSGKDGGASPLASISKIVDGIATDFVKVVKKIRVFVAPVPARACREKAGKYGLGLEVLQAIIEARL